MPTKNSWNDITKDLSKKLTAFQGILALDSPGEMSKLFLNEGKRRDRENGF
jgi:hypothetical protein